MIPIILGLLGAWDLSFPGANAGFFDARYFFNPDEDHLVWALIEDDVTMVRYGPLTMGIGLSVETFMGKSDQHGDTAFNVYGGHWNIRGTVGMDWGDLLFTLFTDHECLHNIDMADTCGQYMNNIMLGVENRIEPRMENHPVFLPGGYVPEYKLSAGIYRPNNPSFQKGHIFDWSLHSHFDFPLLSAGSMLYGTVLKSDFFFHLDGGESSRHYGEIYAMNRTEHGNMTAFIRHHIHDTQPIRSMEGETCFGIRFQWEQSTLFP